MNQTNTDGNLLRKRAEKLLGEDSERLDTISKKEIHTLAHELAVHQIELEVQNEELRQAQIELTNSRDKYQDLYDFAPVGYMTLDSNGVISEANLTSAKMLGIERGKLINKMLTPLSSQPHAVSLHGLIRDSYASETPRLFDATLKKKDGTALYAQILSVVCTKTPENERQLRLAITDVTQLKQLEQQRKDLAKFPEENINPVLRISSNGKLLYANNASADLLIKWNTSIGKVLCHDIKYLIADVCASRKHKVVEIEAADRLYSLTIAPIPHMNYANIYGYDITEQRRLENQLHQKEKLEVVGQLAGGIAHDFNNQLAGIVGFSEVLTNKLTDEAMLGYVDKIRTIALRSADLTRQLLDFAHAGNAQSVPVDIHAIIDDVISILEHTINKRICITKKLNAFFFSTLGDPTQLQNALFNIALNACDAMPQGGNLVFVTTVETIDEQFCGNSLLNVSPGTYISITISDSGKGMDPDIQKHIFEPFFTTKEVGKGTGMGLASVYGTLDRHHGTCSIISNLDKGTTFSIYLPLLESAPKSKALKKASPALDMNDICILLIDDEAMIRELTTDLLEERGFTVTTAENGMEGIDFYKKSWREIDLVILDMIMPELGGRETLIELKKINPDINVIISSGFSVPSNVDNILDKKKVIHLPKPYKEQELLQKIKEATGRESDSR